MKKVSFLLIVLAAVFSGFAQTPWNLGGNALASFERLGSTNGFDLRLMANNNTLMSLKPNGRIGFGVVNPLNKFHYRGLVRIEDSIGVTNSPLMILNGRSNNATIELRTNDTLRTIFGYDESSRTFNINTLGPVTSSFSVNRLTKEIGIGTSQISDNLINVWGNMNLDGDLNMIPTAGKGDINFLTPEQNIAFATPTNNSHAAMMYMFGQPSAYKRMVLAHSLGFGNWGLQYDDPADQFDFMAAGNSRLSINLPLGRVGVNQPAPLYAFDVNGTTRLAENVGIKANPDATHFLKVGNANGASIGIGSLEYIADSGANLLSVRASLAPTSDNIFLLGNSGKRWTSLWATDGTINTSDAREKTNIKELRYGLKEIMLLHPVSYNWKKQPGDGDRLGVLAQEIQKILPEVVRDYDYIIDEITGQKTKVKADRLGVMYSDIIPVLIHAIQEQQAEIEELKALVLQSQDSQTNTAVIKNSGNNLSQNKPNPAKGITTITYSGAGKDAQLIIADAMGNKVQQHLLSAAAGTVQIDCSQLAAGTYTYTLITHGKTISSKRMIVVQ